MIAMIAEIINVHADCSVSEPRFAYFNVVGHLRVRGANETLNRRFGEYNTQQRQQQQQKKKKVGIIVSFAVTQHNDVRNDQINRENTTRVARDQISFLTQQHVWLVTA